MKNLKTIALALIALVPLAASAQVHPKSVNHRQHEQRVRIAQSVHKGSLTRAEAARLRAREASIRARERRQRHDGHGLNRWERARIERSQNRLSHRIHQQKHDGQHRH